jgi:ABC-2 type transport system permease protein
MTVLAIARNGLLESIRQPIFGIVLLAGMFALTLNVSLAGFTLEDDNKILLDLGLSTLFLSGLLLAAFTAAGVLSREIDNRSVVTVVSKPVPRPAIVIGKYLGVVAALAVGCWSLTVVFLLTVRHRVPSENPSDSGFDGPVLLFGLLAIVTAVLISASANYLRGRSFSSVFVVTQAVTATAALALAWCVDKDWRLQNPAIEWNPQLMIAVLLVFEAILVLAAVAIASSTRWGQLMTLMACVAVFLGGLVSEYFLGTVANDARGLSPVLRWLAWPIYAALPNMQFFWQADALTQGQVISLAHFGRVSLYAAAMITGWLGLAVLLFQGRDVG